MFEVNLTRIMVPNSAILPLMIVVGVVLAVAGCKSAPFGAPGLRDGRLAGCPDSPNCVSTESYRDKHSIAPLTFRSSTGDALECLTRIITGMKRAKIVAADGNYIGAEFRTLLGFVDDVELYVDDKSRTIRMRSASRIGYSDFGVNRRRLEEIRNRFDRECG
jgi:uncharacterized protein (DUF1499 family)